jgi:small-conductance mechanosensitive channel
MNPLLRGLLVISVIAGVIVALQIEETLTALFLLAQIAFFLAIAFFVYLVWRERRGEIDSWSTRARVVFYGAALLLVADIASLFFQDLAGFGAIAFFAVLGIGGFSMWRVWRDQHLYG